MTEWSWSKLYFLATLKKIFDWHSDLTFRYHLQDMGSNEMNIWCSSGPAKQWQQTICEPNVSPSRWNLAAPGKPSKSWEQSCCSGSIFVPRTSSLSLPQETTLETRSPLQDSRYIIFSTFSLYIQLQVLHESFSECMVHHKTQSLSTLSLWCELCHRILAFVFRRACLGLISREGIEVAYHSRNVAF